MYTLENWSRYRVGRKEYIQGNIEYMDGTQDSLMVSVFSIDDNYTEVVTDCGEVFRLGKRYGV